MTQDDELSREELEEQTAQELPDREAMSLVDLEGASMTAAPVPVDSDEEIFVPDKTYPLDHEPAPIVPHSSDT